MKRTPAYGHSESFSPTGDGQLSGLYNGVYIDPADLRELRSIDQLERELIRRREGILSRYENQAGITSVQPSLVRCIITRPEKLTDDQLGRFITFLYEEKIFKELTKYRIAIENLTPRFSDEPRYIRMEPITSTVPTATLAKIFSFLFDTYAIESKPIDILPEHFLSDTGSPLNEHTIKKSIGGERNKLYPLDSYLQDMLKAIFP